MITRTQEQLDVINEIVNGCGDVAVTAAAGSGKTDTIVAATRALVDSGVNEERILFLTFSRKAKQELQERLAKAGLKDLAEQNVRTFHSHAMKSIKPSREQKCIDTLPSKRTALIKKSLVKGETLQAVFRDVEDEAFDFDPPEVADVRKIATVAEAYCIDLADPSAKNWLVDNGYSIHFQAVWERYRKHMAADGYWDFSSILLAYEKIAASEQGEWDFVIVDEAQDLNLLQYNIIRKITTSCGRRILVGDARQTVHRWRGADAKLFKKFCMAMPTTHMELTVNFRSVQDIVDLANVIMDDHTPSVAHKASTPGRQHVVNNFDGSAVLLSKVTRELVDGEALQGKSFAILARYNKVVEKLAIALVKNGNTTLTISKPPFSEYIRSKLQPKPMMTTEQWRTWLNDERARQDQKSKMFAALTLALEYPDYDTFYKATKPLFAEQQTSMLLNRPVGSLFVGTIHSAKGGGWDHVLVAFDGWNPHDHERGHDIEEEKCLYYTAVTRAKESLILCRQPA